jgi:hypothetical protein
MRHSLRNRFFSAALHAAFFCAVNTAPAVAGGVGALEGTVTVSGTGAPIEGATVSFNAALLAFSATTDTKGAFRIGDIPAGSLFGVTVANEGGASAMFTVSIRPGETTRARFVLPSAYLRIMSPNGGESIFAGSEVPIRWESAGVDSLRVEFSINDGRDWMLLEKAVAAAPGSYTWDVQDIPSPYYRIRLTDTERPELSDTSDGPFGTSSI